MTNYKSLIMVALLAAAAGAGYLIIQSPGTDTQETQNLPSAEQQKEELSSPKPEPKPDSPSTSSQPSPSAPPPSSQHITTPPAQPIAEPPAKGTSRLVLAITDDTVGNANVDSIFLSITNITLQNTNARTVLVSQELRTYDLLQLKRDGKLERMLDETIPDGTYNHLLVTIGSVVIVKDGLANTAKLPSTTLRIPILLPVRPNQTAAITLDFMADTSLHISAENQLIFAPVIHVNALGEIQTVQTSGSKVEFFGGLPKFAASFGMDETGAMKQNSLGIDSLSRIEIERNVFILTPHSISRSLFTVTPIAAMDATINGAHLTHVSAVYAVIADKQPMWRIYGTLNGTARNVYVDGVTGIVTKVE